MRQQRVTRVVDALRSQGRVIVWMECHHTLSFPSMDQARAGAIMRGDEMLTHDCVFCPDLSQREVRESKSVQRLYREAGEPDDA
jgi:hypothetical protein